MVNLTNGNYLLIKVICIYFMSHFETGFGQSEDLDLGERRSKNGD